MPELLFPRLTPKLHRKRLTRSCAGHRAWVKRHHCSVPGCRRTPIECAHVRRGTDGATGMKPSDRWVISLCSAHHREQHVRGERAFEAEYGIDMVALAIEFAWRSPHRPKLLEM